MSGPTNEEQYYLELINDARLDPMGDAAKYITSYSPLTSADPDIQEALSYFGVSGTALQAAFSSLTPVAPVAWNDNLATAARNHTAAMIAADMQSHQLPGEAYFSTRDQNAGYTGWTELGENVYAYADDPLYGQAGFMVDWGNGTNGMQSPPGHRDNIMDADFTEVGIGVTDEDDPTTGVGPQVVTEDFGTRGHTFLLGVAYDDTDDNHFYTPGEGLSGLTVSYGGTTATSTSSGGYTLDMTSIGAGATFIFAGAGLAGPVSFTPLSLSQNIEVDIVNGDTLETSASGTVNGAADIDVLGATGLSLTAGDGAQTFTGGAGDDSFNGGRGIDTVVYSGDRADYSIVREAGGVVQVTDNRTGSPDGTDTLNAIERLRFADATVALQTHGDINGDGTTDILFRAPDATITDWLMAGSGSTGGGLVASSPDAVVAFGAFDGTGASQPLFRGIDGRLYFWDTNYGPSDQHVLVAPQDPNYEFIAAGDFDGDGNDDVLFFDPDTASYVIWANTGLATAGMTGMTGSYGSVGTPGASWVFKAAGDFDGDGRADLLFENAAGTYMTWLMDGTTVASTATFAGPGAGWFFKATGDFNGDGKADLLFENSDGHHAIWDMSGAAVTGGGDIGDPGSAWTLAGIGDYNGDGNSDLLFRDASGDYSIWDMSNTAIIGSGDIGNPGAGYSLALPLATETFAPLLFQDASGAVATWLIGGDAIGGGGIVGNAGANWSALTIADFAATGEQDILFRSTDGTLAIWRVDGTTLLGGGNVGNPGTDWAFVAAADFNGDGKADLLLHNTQTGAYATWDMSGTAIVGGGTIGTAPGYTAVATGDFNGDGKADILFSDAAGNLAVWLMNDTQIAGGGVIGNPGGTWQVKGTGDFNGDGKSDILFEDASGNYAIWDMNDTAIIGGGVIGNPGGSWQLAKVADLNQDGKADLLFVDSTGHYASWLMSDTTIVAGASFGAAGGSWHLA
jgi:uncharacterized protein YkwD